MSAPLPPVTLVLGGARSGKSRYAEELIEAQAQGEGQALYLATAEALDEEMSARIQKHKDRRGAVWATIEETRELVAVLDREARPDRPILVDCLTLWLSNLLFNDLKAGDEIQKLADFLQSGALRGPVVFVSNEIGLGVTPDNQLARLFVDAQGELNQLIAKLANRVVFVAAGLPQILKDETPILKDETKT